MHGFVAFVLWTGFVFFVGGLIGWTKYIYPVDYERANAACLELASGSPVEKFTRTVAVCANGATIELDLKK